MKTYKHTNFYDFVKQECRLSLRNDVAYLWLSCLYLLVVIKHLSFVIGRVILLILFPIKWLYVLIVAWFDYRRFAKLLEIPRDGKTHDLKVKDRYYSTSDVMNMAEKVVREASYGFGDVSNPVKFDDINETLETIPKAVDNWEVELNSKIHDDINLKKD